jgi:hypothetical protein
MGLFSNLLGAAAPIVGSAFGPVGGAIGGLLGGAISGSGGPKSQTATTQNQIDPRIANILFGQNGSSGLLNQFAGLANTPQSAASSSIGQTAGNYLTGVAPTDFDQIRQSALGLIRGNQAPSISNPLWTTGAQVKGPSQANLNLSGNFNQFLNGDAGANPYLKSSIQAGIDATNAGFQNNQRDITNTLQRQVLPGIRSGAIASGQYGSSRQGIAEGNALSDYTKQLTGANTQLGLQNSANAIGAQANAFNQGQDRSLSALLNLSGQQFGQASQNAALDQQAQLANQAVNTDYVKSNQAAQLATNAQNNAASSAGANQLSNLFSQLYGVSNNNDNYAIDRAGRVSGLLSPFLNVNSSQTSSQPLYQNRAGNAFGGALAGASLGNSFGGNDNSLFRLFGGLNGSL